MRLHLVQHGDAAPEAADPARPLSARGRREVAAVARLLAAAGVRPARILHSGKLRAADTAALLAAGLAPGLAPEAVTGLNPSDPVEPWVGTIGGWAAEGMLVGHLPFMGRLAARLVAGDERRPVVAFTPGAVACLERGEGVWAIAWMLRPELAPSRE
jgi:phosphohistidine phosphatase